MTAWYLWKIQSQSEDWLSATAFLNCIRGKAQFFAHPHSGTSGSKTSGTLFTICFLFTEAVLYRSYLSEQAMSKIFDKLLLWWLAPNLSS